MKRILMIAMTPSARGHSVSAQDRPAQGAVKSWNKWPNN